MNQISFFAFQVFFFVSIAHADGTLVRPGSFSAVHRTLTVATKGSSSNVLALPTVQRTADFLTDVGSGAARWLGASAAIFKLGQLFQQDLQKSDEIAQEAERRSQISKDLFKHEKTFEELVEERNQRVKELKEKILENRNEVRVSKDEPFEEEMRDELHELLTKPLKPDLGQEDEEIGIIAQEVEPGVLAQLAVSGPYVVPGMWMMPNSPTAPTAPTAQTGAGSAQLEPLAPEVVEDVYHDRDWEWVEIKVGGLMGIYRPKQRTGGVGPHGLIEASLYTKSLACFEALERYDIEKPRTNYEYVFGRTAGVVYVAWNAMGHPSIKLRSKAQDPCGGELHWVGDVLRTNELSGHYGKNWDDESRYAFIELMSVLRVRVLHEPYSVDFLFSRISEEDLGCYQENFLRKKSNSVFNPNLGCLTVFATEYSSVQYRKNPLYEEVSENQFNLKRKYIGKGTLDQKYGFRDPDEMLRSLETRFRQQYPQVMPANNI